MCSLLRDLAVVTPCVAAIHGNSRVLPRGFVTPLTLDGDIRKGYMLLGPRSGRHQITLVAHV
jgi:hypothetical protein